MISEHALWIGGGESKCGTKWPSGRVHPMSLQVVEFEICLVPLPGFVMSLLGNCVASDVGGSFPCVFSILNSFTLALSHVSPSGTPYVVQIWLYLLNIGPLQNRANTCDVAGTHATLFSYCDQQMATHCYTQWWHGMLDRMVFLSECHALDIYLGCLDVPTFMNRDKHQSICSRKRVFSCSHGISGGAQGYSSMFRRSYVEKVLCWEGSMFRRSFVQKVLCSEGSMFRRFYIQKVLCSEGPMFRNICSEGPMFRKCGWIFEWLTGKVIQVRNSILYSCFLGGKLNI